MQPSTLFINSTFKNSKLHQLFSVHCKNNKSYIPLVYNVFPLETTYCYLDAFNYIVNECRKSYLLTS